MQSTAEFQSLPLDVPKVKFTDQDGDHLQIVPVSDDDREQYLVSVIAVNPATGSAANVWLTPNQAAELSEFLKDAAVYTALANVATGKGSVLEHETDLPPYSIVGEV